ncbi:hypothetical protein [Streptomyces tremellae]|uniref:Uncharacterized protein n=1 Tax=Streptomyces tremellae TaxID=1124239 RepID=A0ABP7EFL2_9ACTN
MDTRTSAAGPAERLCHWHSGTSTTARLVATYPPVSGGGAADLYACADCRERHGLTPIDTLTTDELYTHLREAVAPYLHLGRAS